MKFYRSLGEVCYRDNIAFIHIIRVHKTYLQKPASTVRFFDRSDYYSLHAEDAHLAAKLVFKSTAGVKTMSPPGNADQLDYMCLSRGNFELILRELLLVQSYRVEVYTKTPTGWDVEFRGSPGNLTAFESVLYQSADVMTGTSIIGLNLKLEGARRVSNTFANEQQAVPTSPTTGIFADCRRRVRRAARTLHFVGPIRRRRLLFRAGGYARRVGTQRVCSAERR